MERLRICRASRVDSIMCGCTSTQRTVDGTGICLTFGLSMPTVSTRPPYSDGAMLSTCTEPLATCSPFIANFSSSSLPSGSGSSALAATTAATADAAEPPSPEPSGMPLSIASSMPKSSFRSRTMHSTRHAGRVALRLARQVDDRAGDGADGDARPGVATRGHAIADRLEAVAEDVEADCDVADAGGRECCGCLPHAQSFTPR